MLQRISSLKEYQTTYKNSIEQSENFWSEVADNFLWKKKWEKVFSGGFEKADYKWFEGGKLNITENCIDRHLEKFGNKTAILWEPNNPTEQNRKISYNELHEAVCQFSNALEKLGIKKGDTVCIYMPMIPELAIAMLSCARIGSIHSIVFGGFSAQSIADRIQDAECKWMITADGCYRGDKPLYLKKIVDEALEKCPSIQKSIVLNRSNFDCNMKADRDVWWSDIMKDCSTKHEAATMDSEDPLFILYTSGSTGKPKGVLHTTAGYMVYSTYTFLNVFQYQPEQIYWCTADIGWVTGHSYIVYGPLLNGATTLMYEGIPQFPDWGRWWEVIDKYKVNIFYTAPTAIRSLEAQGLKFLEGKSLESLRVLGTVGEPINEEAWEWYHKNIGKEKCPIVDTWWQTETGGILISSLAGVTPVKPSFATLPFLGVEPLIVDANGKEIKEIIAEGNLCIRKSWPGQARTVYKDHERFIQTYFTTYPGMYFTGDGCKRDYDGNYRITGRVDDVINVSGHRIGTAEVENAINEHLDVYESAVVGFPHFIKGQGIFAFVSCEPQPKDIILFKQEVLNIVAKIIGPFAKPDRIEIVSGLPKTRSGKIMRRILRKIAEGEFDKVGDVTTLLNPEVVEEIKKKVKG
ncbi:acetyl-coenzyme A synthetase [Bacteroidota bacterium]|nr:acetyl-coenzyme A synthetase [Bacteroidota bacterium]